MTDSSFDAALSGEAPLLMDGAMGTELTRIGRRIGSSDWVASTLGSADDVTRIHRSYAQAGAQIHIANTFATGRHVLADVGLEDRFEEINRDAVRVCREAIAGASAPETWIAGSISTYVIGSDRANLPRSEALTANVREQAMLLADAGCDLLVLEMLFDVDVSLTMIHAAREAGLPVSVGLTCDRNADGTISTHGEFQGRAAGRVALDEAIPALAAAIPADPAIIMTIMHSHLDVTDEAIAIIARRWDGPIGAYPNSGRWLPPDNWDHDAVCSPEDFVTHARSWEANGVRMIGGCCGIGPAHIAALAADRV